LLLVLLSLLRGDGAAPVPLPAAAAAARSGARRRQRCGPVGLVLVWFGGGDEVVAINVGR
jgi:hypothetical protein